MDHYQTSEFSKSFVPMVGYDNYFDPEYSISDVIKLFDGFEMIIVGLGLCADGNKCYYLNDGSICLIEDIVLVRRG